MSRSRVAYLCLQATTEGQASYAHVHEIIDGLRKMGWHIDLFDVDYGQDRSPGIPKRLVEFVRVQVQLISRIRRYDAVYVRSHPLAFPVALAARWAGIPVVQECNGPFGDVFAAWPAARIAGPAIIALQAMQYRLCDAVVAVDHALARWLERECRASDVAVIPNAANVELFHPDAPPGADVLPPSYAVFFGTLAVWQGVNVMIDAVKDPEWPSEVRLVIVGDGALAGEVRAAALADQRIIYLGQKPYTQVPGIVSRALCSLVVKDSELHATTGLSPLKVYESMACGVPVIASEVAGMGETVCDAGAGILTPRGDSRSVARAVAVLAADPEAARGMGERGRRAAVTLHSWTVRARATADVLCRVIRERPDVMR